MRPVVFVCLLLNSLASAQVNPKVIDLAELPFTLSVPGHLAMDAESAKYGIRFGQIISISFGDASTDPNYGITIKYVEPLSRAKAKELGVSGSDEQRTATWAAQTYAIERKNYPKAKFMPLRAATFPGVSGWAWSKVITTPGWLETAGTYWEFQKYGYNDGASLYVSVTAYPGFEKQGQALYNMAMRSLKFRDGVRR
ncbi:hypothetical protein DAERI_070091 [Deinococcus aerius]|uniref:Uncharacterized protein n=2 Tax=Deinococcus aerius TaxID=200253 RepID=A0A2I9CVW3_9DEIO|nr:hypothetical protein DAERI_070091 [Deinococcus aerius]